MNITVNGQKIDSTLENEKTVGDVLTAFQAICDENAAAVIGIAVDGERITAAHFDTVAQRTLTPETSFAFDVITKQALLTTFKELSERFTLLAGRMEQIPAALQNGHGNDARESIAELADAIDSFCHTTALASLFPEILDAVSVEGKKLADFISEFPPLLADFEQALAAQDTVQIGDLAEYEICPRLTALGAALRNDA